MALSALTKSEANFLRTGEILRIFKANLCLRFYRSDGWTRQQVCDLMIEPDIGRILPRYEGDKDKSIVIERGFRYDDPGDFDDCDYFCILGCGNNFRPYDGEKLKCHEVY